MDLPSELRYTQEHEWVRVEGERAVVGITDYAQDALGDLVYVDLPQPGRQVTAGEAICEVESTKSVSDVYAPVAGEVLEVNEALSDAPQRINEDPYGDGWIWAMRVADPAELETLLDADAYRQLIDEG